MMKKIIYRLLAYAIDILLVTMLTMGITYLPMFKETNSKVGAIYVSLSTNELTYNALTEKLDKYYEDAKFSETELEEIKTDYSNFYSCFDKVKVDEEVTNELKSDISKNIKETYVDIKNDYAYQINKYNIVQSIIGVILYILYFGVLQYVLKGQTLGKKLFKLKVVGMEKEKVSLLNYILRSILVCEIIITAIDLIFLTTMSKSLYIASNYWLLQAKYIYEIGFIVVMIIRDDFRSVHDLLLNTKVIMLDKNGKEIIEKDEKNSNKTN